MRGIVPKVCLYPSYIQVKSFATGHVETISCCSIATHIRFRRRNFWKSSYTTHSIWAPTISEELAYWIWVPKISRWAPNILEELTRQAYLILAAKIWFWASGRLESKFWRSVHLFVCLFDCWAEQTMLSQIHFAAASSPVDSGLLRRLRAPQTTAAAPSPPPPPIPRRGTAESPPHLKP